MKNHKISWGFFALFALFLFFVHIFTAQLFLFHQRMDIIHHPPLDDAWIHLVYAKNLVQKGGFFYNDGMWESGMNSPLWVVILAGGFKVYPLLLNYPVLWAKICSFIFSFGSTLMVFLLVKHVSQKRSYAVGASLMLSLNSDHVFNQVSAMETSLYIFLVLTVVYAMLKNKQKTAGFLLALAVLARPESVVVCALTFLVFYLPRYLKRHQVCFLTKEEQKIMLNILGPPILSFSLWMGYNLLVTGFPLPNSFYVKHADLGWLNLQNLYHIWYTYLRYHMFFSSYYTMIGFLVFVAVLVLVLCLKKKWPELMIVLLPFVLIYFFSITQKIGYAEVEWTYMTRRYLDIIWPFFIMSAVMIIQQVWQFLKTYFNQPAVKSAIAVFFLPPYFISVLLMPLKNIDIRWQKLPQQYVDNCQNIGEVNEKMAQWLEENIPHEAVIGVGDAGALKYFTSHHVEDIVGLNSHENIGKPFKQVAEEKELDYVVVFADDFIKNWDDVREIYHVETDRNTILGGHYLAVYETKWSKFHYEDGEFNRTLL